MSVTDRPAAPDVNAGSVEAIYERLRAEIITGTLAAGTIVNQVDLARSLGVSRTPLREALRMLQAQDLVRAEHQHRMRVTELLPEAIDALYATRIQLECLALAMTIPVLTNDELDELNCLVAQIEVRAALDGTAYVSWQRAHQRFHRVLVSAGTPGLTQTIETFMDHAERCRHQYMNTTRSSKVSNDDHPLLVSAAKKRDVTSAVQVLARHLARVGLGLLGNIAPEVEPVAIRQALHLSGVR